MEDVRDEFLVNRDIEENVADNMILVTKETLGEYGSMVPEATEVGMIFKDEKEL